MNKTYGITDSHAHICGDLLISEFDRVVTEAKEEGITKILIVCTRVEEAKKAIELARDNEIFDVALAFYPNDLIKISKEEFLLMEQLIKKEEIIAVGEIGMDTVCKDVPLEIQKEAFIRQMKLANEVKKPVLIHMREATQYVLPMMKEYLKVPGIMHCYSGGYDVMKEFLDLGMYLSFSGNITFEDDMQTYLAVKNVPLDRILVETDAPSLTPAPMQHLNNEPKYITYVIDRICEIREITREALIQATSENYRRLFASQL